MTVLYSITAGQPQLLLTKSCLQQKRSTPHFACNVTYFLNEHWVYQRTNELASPFTPHLLIFTSVKFSDWTYHNEW